MAEDPERLSPAECVPGRSHGRSHRHRHIPFAWRQRQPDRPISATRDAGRKYRFSICLTGAEDFEAFLRPEPMHKETLVDSCAPTLPQPLLMCAPVTVTAPLQRCGRQPVISKMPSRSDKRGWEFMRRTIEITLWVLTL